MEKLKKRKIIITQNALQAFAGSEIVTLELAEYLQSIGMEVVVFTWFLDDPMKTEFSKRNITVTTDDYDPILKKADYVWVQHQAIPFSILDGLQKQIKRPIFVFLHMSALKEIYLEQPYVYNLERQISSKSLFMAEEALQLAKDYYYGYFEKYDKVGVYPNPVPEVYLSRCERGGELKKILIVSNHPTKEVDEACKVLSQKGITTELLGKDGVSKLISREILSQYDLVITVAKSVQYCLCTGVPVYIYDHFGGCGYLNFKNIKKASRNNYSGRGFNKKTSEQIATEIIEGYNDAYKFQNDNIKGFQEKYSIANNIKSVFNDIKPVKIRFDEKYIFYIKSVESLARGMVVAEHQIVFKNKELEKERNDLRKIQVEMNKLLEDKKWRESLTMRQRIYLKIRFMLLGR